MSDRSPVPDPLPAPRLRMEPAPRPRTAYSTDAGEPQFVNPAAEGPRFDSIRLREYVRVLYKRRWTAAAAFTIVMAATVVYTFSKVPVYDARVRLMIEPERRVPGSRSLVDDEAVALIDFQTQHAIVNSHAFARKTMQALKIWEPGQYAAAHPAQVGGGGLGGMLGGLWADVKGYFAGKNEPSGTVPAPAPAQAVAGGAGEDTPEAQAARVGAFLSGVRVAPVPRSRMIEITYRSPSPEKAATYANAIARQYIEQNLEFKFLATKEASDWLSERLVEQRKRVEDAEQAVQEYRQKHQVVASPDERVKASIQRLSELTTAVTRAKTERIEKESAYNRVKAVLNDRAALDALPEIMSNVTIQEIRGQLVAATKHHAQLSERLLGGHPDLQKARKAVEDTQARLDAAIDNVVKLVRSEYQSALAAENSLAQVYEQQRREAMQYDQGDIDYALLVRSADSNRQIYDTMLQRARESEVAGQPTSNNIRILDPAEVPRSPSGGGRMNDIRVGALAGVSFALLLVWFFEYIDNRVKSPSDIQMYLNQPYLGLIPSLHTKTLAGKEPLVNGDVPFQFTESFRGIRTNVLFSTAQEGVRAITVTSAQPGEGKTIVSCNLAMSLALAGQRVLLIDGDLRRPRVHQVFDVAQEPGLSNFIVGSAAAADVIHRSSINGLWVLAAGRVPPNPAELLGSKRFAEFVSRLESHFDWVIMDSPPAVPVTDPAVLAHMATATILVVSAEKTSRYSAREALDRLEAAGGRILGVVLNYVDFDDNPYYYARQYKTYYTSYESAAKAQAK